MDDKYLDDTIKRLEGYIMDLHSLLYGVQGDLGRLDENIASLNSGVSYLSSGHERTLLFINSIESAFNRWCRQRDELGVNPDGDESSFDDFLDALVANIGEINEV